MAAGLLVLFVLCSFAYVVSKAWETARKLAGKTPPKRKWWQPKPKNTSTVFLFLAIVCISVFVVRVLRI